MAVQHMFAVLGSNHALRTIKLKAPTPDTESTYKAELGAEYERVIVAERHHRSPSLIQLLQNELSALRTKTTDELAAYPHRQG